MIVTMHHGKAEGKRVNEEVMHTPLALLVVVRLYHAVVSGCCLVGMLTTAEVLDNGGFRIGFAAFFTAENVESAGSLHVRA